MTFHDKRRKLRSLNESAIILSINAQIVDSNAHVKEIHRKKVLISHKVSFVFNLQYSLRLFYIFFLFSINRKLPIKKEKENLSSLITNHKTASGEEKQ